MIKEIEIQKTITEPEYIECDRCHDKIYAGDCAGCLYSKMVNVTKYSDDNMIEFHLCDKCFDEIVKKENIVVKVITNDPIGDSYEV